MDVESAAGAMMGYVELEAPEGHEGGGEITEEQRAAWIKSLDERLAQNSLGGHWQHHERPKPIEPVLWRWNDIYSGLIESGEAVRLGQDTQRRTVQLRNPGLAAGTSRTIQMSVQLVKPGEWARAHRHTAQAIRFAVQGHGAFTTVEGERLFMEPNDLILTPGWTWHDHTNDADEPVIWLDGLDIPLASHLDAQFQVNFPEDMQPITKADGASARAYSPARSRKDAANPWPYPPYRYVWAETLPVLEELAALDRDEGDDPYEGVLLEYANPLTGGHTLPTISCRVQLLRPGQATAAHRHTGTAIYHAIEGSGTVYIDDVPFEWAPRDCFVIPSWRTHRFENSSSTERTILFSMTDLPVLEALNLYREEDVAVN